MSDTKNAKPAQAALVVQINEDGRLECPGCPGDGAYLHHRVVNVFSRREDNPSQLTSVFHNGTVNVQGNAAGNPSARRDGVSIRFSCELCGGGYALELAQHKGQTEMHWRELSEAEAVWLFSDLQKDAY
jgi:hypothetical protein